MTTDSSIAIGIFSIFLALAVIIPFVNEGFNQSSNDINLDGFEETIGQDDKGIGAGDIFISIFKMFFWSFGTFHWAIELILTIMRVTLAWLIIRIIRGVG